MVPVRKDNVSRFIRYDLTALDYLTNLVIEKKLPPQIMAYYLWLCSYAWEAIEERRQELGERNPCKIPLAAHAKYFKVSRGTIGKWLKKLSGLKLAKTEYIVKINASNKKRKFQEYAKAWAYKNAKGGLLYGTEVFILNDDIIVGRGGKKRKRNPYSSSASDSAVGGLH